MCNTSASSIRVALYEGPREALRELLELAEDSAAQLDSYIDRARVLVATAAADTGNLRFYQRLGFRMAWIEHDAFTEPSGYPGRIDIDGIRLRDRVWLSMVVHLLAGDALADR